MSRFFVLLNHPMVIKRPYVVSILHETPLVAQIYRESKNDYLTAPQTEKLGFFAGSMIRGMLLEFTPRTREPDSPGPFRELREWEGSRPVELV